MITIRDGTTADPILNPGTGAEATADSLVIQNVVMDSFGSNYTAPTVDITDPNPTVAAAVASATVSDAGIVGSIDVLTQGAGYVTPGMKKFVDTLPGLCDPPGYGSSCTAAANNLGQYLPIAVPDTTTFPRRGLLRHRPGPAARADELFAPGARNPASQVRAAHDGCA